MAIAISLRRLAQSGRRPYTESNAAQRALAAANVRFAKCYPAWAEAFFDDYFVYQRLAPRIAAGLDAAAIAGHWASQLNWPNPQTRQRRIAELTPAAAHFLAWFEAGLSETTA